MIKPFLISKYLGPVFFMTLVKNKVTAFLKIITLTCFFFIPFILFSQVKIKDSVLAEVTIATAINYALTHQPAIQQSLIDQQIVGATIKSKLSEMFPQVNLNYSLQYNLIRPISVIGGNPVQLGVNNSSVGQFTFSQTIFNKDVLLARRTQKDIKQQSTLATSSAKIDLAADVSKAFYDIMATIQQIKIAGENILRIQQSLKDAVSQYQSGAADKIDFKRATISLNSSVSAKNSYEAILKAKIVVLKTLMGFPETENLKIVFDTTQMEKEILLDTLQTPDFTNRIEYRLLETQKRLLQHNVNYYQWSYLPSLSANAAYNLSYQSDQFYKLYLNNFPNSFASFNLVFPLLQGGKRRANKNSAALYLQRNKQDLIQLENRVNSGYALALAVYKVNMQNYLSLKENLLLAREVYDVIQLQYRSGIKTYLEVITAEADLRSTQINYFTAMYQLLASKIDVQKSLGQINY